MGGGIVGEETAVVKTSRRGISVALHVLDKAIQVVAASNSGEVGLRRPEQGRGRSAQVAELWIRRRNKVRTDSTAAGTVAIQVSTASFAAGGSDCGNAVGEPRRLLNQRVAEGSVRDEAIAPALNTLRFHAHDERGIQFKFPETKEE